MTRGDWLLMRKGGICASESAAILGLSPWATALDVWMTKLDGSPPKDTISLVMGQVMEPVIARLYCEQTKNTLVKPEHITTHPVHGCIKASLDYTDVARKRIIECKNTRTPVGWGEEETDEVPKHIWVQCQHQMLASGIMFCDVAVLIAGSEFRIYHVNYDEAFCSQLLEICIDFWNTHIIGRKRPEVDWEHPATEKAINYMYREIEENSIELTSYELKIAKEMILLQEVEKQTRSEINALKAKLRDAVGNASTAVLPNGWKVVRKLVKRGAYEVAATSYVDMRIKQHTKRSS